MENISQQQPPSKYKNGKGILIAGIILIIIAIIVIAGAVFYVINQNSTTGKTIEKASTAKNTKVNPEDNTIPSNWASDVPTYTNATILKKLSNKVSDSIVCTTNDSVSQVSDYFKNKLASSGWKIIATKNANSIEGMKDTRILVVTFTSSAKSTKTIFEESVANRK